MTYRRRKNLLHRYASNFLFRRFYDRVREKFLRIAHIYMHVRHLRFGRWYSDASYDRVTSRSFADVTGESWISREFTEKIGWEGGARYDNGLLEYAAPSSKSSGHSSHIQTYMYVREFTKVFSFAHRERERKERKGENCIYIYI